MPHWKPLILTMIHKKSMVHWLTAIAVLVLVGLSWLTFEKAEEPTGSLVSGPVNRTVDKSQATVAAKERDGSPLPAKHDDLASLSTDIREMKRLLIKSEKARSRVLASKEGETYSMVSIFIEKPDETFQKEMSAKIEQLRSRAVADYGKPPAATGKQLDELGDFLHWQRDPHTGEEYKIRIVGWHVINTGVEEREDVLVQQAESFETLSTATGTTIRFKGNSSLRTPPLEDAQARYGHLFEFEER